MALEGELLAELRRLSRDLERHDERMSQAIEQVRNDQAEQRVGIELAARSLERAAAAAQANLEEQRKNEREQLKLLRWLIGVVIVLALGRMGLDLLQHAGPLP